MINYFECKVGYDKMLENGIQKRVIESYLVDALSFTEAEARIIEETRPYITGEFIIISIKRYPLSETFFNDSGDRYFRIKVNFITLDEKSGAEKKTPVHMLVQASNIDEAKEHFENGMRGTMNDYEIEKIEETKILDVYRYSKTE